MFSKIGFPFLTTFFYCIPNEGLLQGRGAGWLDGDELVVDHIGAQVHARHIRRSI